MQQKDIKKLSTVSMHTFSPNFIDSLQESKYNKYQFWYLKATNKSQYF